jgi:hypothetical protein
MSLLMGIYHWLSPVYAGEENGQTVVIYTTFPKAFYLYLVWLPGLALWALKSWGMLQGPAGVWLMMAAVALAYMVIAEDLTVNGFVVLITWLAAMLALYFTGWLNWTGLPLLLEKLKNIKMALDPEALKVFSIGLFVVWLLVYLYSVTWRKRELSSLRRSKLRPPLGRKPLPITGLVVDLSPRDMLELIFGFGSQDVLIETQDGRVLDRDTNCIGLAFVSGPFNRLISELTVREDKPAAV